MDVIFTSYDESLVEGEKLLKEQQLNDAFALRTLLENALGLVNDRFDELKEDLAKEHINVKEYISREQRKNDSQLEEQDKKIDSAVASIKDEVFEYIEGNIKDELFTKLEESLNKKLIEFLTAKLSGASITI